MKFSSSTMANQGREDDWGNVSNVAQARAIAAMIEEAAAFGMTVADIAVQQAPSPRRDPNVRQAPIPLSQVLIDRQAEIQGPRPMSDTSMLQVAIPVPQTLIDRESKILGPMPRSDTIGYMLRCHYQGWRCIDGRGTCLKT